MPGNRSYSLALLCVALSFFAVLAMDITVPAVILSIMALARWGLLAANDLAGSSVAWKGETA